MPNTASASKRMRQNIKRRNANMSKRSMLRTHIKKILATIEDKDKDKANSEFVVLQKLLDRAATKGIFSANKVARHKSRINKKIKSLAQNNVASTAK